MMISTVATRIHLEGRQSRKDGPSIAKNQRAAIGMAMRGNSESNNFDGLANEKNRDNLQHFYDDWLFDDRKQRVAFYGLLAILETIFWYWLAPGIDPESRWFNPLDGELIASLLDPSNVFSPQASSGLGFSSLLLNTFLVLPMVWSLFLLQEQKDNNNLTSAIRICVCACGFIVGGGILVPYMIFRRPMPFRRYIDPDQFPTALKLFEEQSLNSTSNPMAILEPIGRSFLLLVVLVVLFSFLLPFANHTSDWGVEWTAFLDRAHSSQFTALALYDFTMISIVLLDPMMDDALRRGYVLGWGTNNECTMDQWKIEKRRAAIIALAPYVLIPLIGPVTWICLRPKFNLGSNK